MNKLEALAGKLARLIELNDDLLYELDLIGGAVLSLAFAREHKFRDRPGPLTAAYLKNAAQRFDDLSRGVMPTTGYWLAGWHFNSALLRIAASYENVLRRLARVTPNDRRGVPDLEVMLPPFSNTNLTEVRRQVNDLKHGLPKVLAGRRVTYEQAVEATQELIDLLLSTRPH